MKRPGSSGAARKLPGSSSISSTILETMLPTHFLAFRGRLRPASGFQSEQFREIEFLCGLKDEKMLRYHEPASPMRAALERRFTAPSLRDVFFEALSGLGVIPPVDPTASEEQRFEAGPWDPRALS